MAYFQPLWPLRPPSIYNLYIPAPIWIKQGYCVLICLSNDIKSLVHEDIVLILEIAGRRPTATAIQKDKVSPL